MVVSRDDLLNSRIMDAKGQEISPEEFSKKLADRLRTLRDKSGLSQECVAHQANISAYTYQKFEKGESKPGTPMNPRLYTLLALAKVFDMDIRELLFFDEYDNAPSAQGSKHQYLG